jgi:hypothetical protein
MTPELFFALTLILPPSISDENQAARDIAEAINGLAAEAALHSCRIFEFARHFSHRPRYS